MATPYRSTPIFDEETLPSALRAVHRTKAGVWAVIRVLEGELRLTLLDVGEEQVLSPGNPGVVAPEQPHSVTPLGTPPGRLRMQVDFYDEPPH